MRDLILTALKTVRRDPKLFDMFNRILAKAQVYTIVKNGNQAYLVKAPVGDEVCEFMACFSSLRLAEQTLKIYSGISGNNTAAAQIKALNALKLFFSAARGGLAIYLNPKNIPSERFFFNPDDVRNFLLGPWALNLNYRPEPKSRRILSRSRGGRAAVSGEKTRLPIPETDFDRPFTIRQLAEIFGASENIISNEITQLEQNGLVDLSVDSISLDESESGQAGATRYFDPVVAFHIGYQIKGPRGDEFRQWHTRLLQEFSGERQSWANEREQLRGQLNEAGQTIQNLEDKLREKTERLAALAALPHKDKESLSQITQELALKDKRIAELRADLEAAGEWLYPESVSEACESARLRYASRLIFHERVAQTVAEFGLNNDLRATAEAVKMFKALAERLHPMKFERDNFSEEQFRDETGIPLSMTESKASKRDKAIEETRVCYYKGRKITFYPHLKRNIQGIQMRLHFQFLSDEKKILICHLGEHLPNAKTKYLS